MKGIHVLRIGVVSIAIMAFAVSCKYDEVLPIKPDPGVQVSFSEDIIPIFNASCNTSGCHNGSGPSPDLSMTAAYVSLWDGGYIDTIMPEASELYLWMSGLNGLPMPVEGVNATYNATVLQWIIQGAQEN